MLYLTVQGTRVPKLGFGTFRITGQDCREAVKDALEIGYRHIDTAQGYGNEAEVGLGIKDSGIGRQDIFLVSKVSPDNFRHERVIQSTEESLRKLDSEFIDLMLLHWPNPEVSLEETLDAMLELKERGTIRHVGVSNFPPSLVKRALEKAKIFANQVEHHPFLGQEKLLGLARAHGFMLTAYSPLAKGDTEKDETLTEIGASYGKSGSQVGLRWLIEQDQVVAIPKASSPKHRRSNFDIFDFELSAEDKARIGALDKTRRMVNPPMAPDWED